MTTFGTPPSTYLLNIPSQPQPEPQNMAMKRKPSTRTAKRDKQRFCGSGSTNTNRLQIGSPVEGSFQKLEMNINHIDFMHDSRFGFGIVGNQSSTLGKPGIIIIGNSKKPVDKVIVKNPKKKAPVLSFNSSTFSKSSLDALVSDIHRKSTYTKNTSHEVIPPESVISRAERKNVDPIYRSSRRNSLTFKQEERTVQQSSVIGSATNDVHQSSRSESTYQRPTRNRSGIDKERGIWYSANTITFPPKSVASSSNNSQAYSQNSSSISRPTLPTRKSINPAEAIYPSVSEDYDTVSDPSSVTPTAQTYTFNGPKSSMKNLIIKDNRSNSISPNYSNSTYTRSIQTHSVMPSYSTTTTQSTKETTNTENLTN
ncbi:uncharacterized protein L201_007173 [Kwoniella dendrophila CBS 6074]|uniref:Uncharacterized protein n=1 Tax=Kwoniella dendrophila CBS 6074 TaxID=1295534 RepID=A0AAX4K4A7_9TREE